MTKITPDDPVVIDQAEFERRMAPFRSKDGAPAPVLTRCGEPGCVALPVDACGYVDSRGAACRTHWCADHGPEVAGQRYCRRHAGTMVALGSKANNPRALPDVGHRGASLVRWVYRDLDPALTTLLDLESRSNEHLLRDTEVAVGRAEDGSRCWEMSWKLASPSGIRVRITLMVEEKDDAVVLVRLGDEVLASGVPPWIEARRLGKHVTEDEDREQRRSFYAFLEEYLTEAIRQV
ncbi:MAG: hypothetical protein M3Z57_06565 [Candidatus Dormibacteraeota bacterium]|nr:hypothetical protein [Candidatus Dormibacteraeota bacterium]